jgi:hypothetical protein
MKINPTTLGGGSKTRNTIIEFPSEDVPIQMYKNPEYQAVIHYRHDFNFGCQDGDLKTFCAGDLSSIKTE